MTAVTNGDASGSFTTAKRLQKIDELRENNVGEHLPLPQLVVVGNQSSGKSSLLESLTGIPFPRGHGLCTRYATQISHRRDEVESIEISIIRAGQAGGDDKDRLEKFKETVASTEELKNNFESILERVKTHLGLKDSPEAKAFSQDVLKIEKRGPNEDFLTVIDVPGLFQATSKGKTEESDIRLVHNMVTEYIADEQTIILAVLPSYADPATQGILQLARKHDQHGERTLGVLTMPDLVSEVSRKMQVCDLVNGKEQALELGYYLVRNQGPDDVDSDTQGREKALFNEEPWRGLPDERKGVKMLRRRLQDLLGQITDRAFPELRAKTRDMLEKSRREQVDLGAPRQSERQQQQYLSSIAGAFQNMARAALDADYSAHKALDNDELRLITSVINITDQFNSDFINSAHTRCFQSTMDAETQHDAAAAGSTSEAESPFGSTDSGIIEVDSQELHQRQNAERRDRSASIEYAELRSIIELEHTPQTPNEYIMDWIESIYRRSRGAELGIFGAGLLSSTFREQSKNWASMTKVYLSRVILVIHRFIVKAIEAECIDGRVRQELMATLIPDLLACYKRGMAQAMFLVDVERDRRPYTLNHYFSSHLQRSRSLRVTATFQGFEEGGKSENTGLMSVIDSIQSAINSKTNTERAKEDIHDILEAYYKVARERFVDNVYQQAVDYYLLSGPQSPLRLFSEHWVLGLGEEKLQAITGEPVLIRDKRQKVEKKIKELQKAMEILQ